MLPPAQHSSRTVKNTYLLSKAPSLWHFVVVAQPIQENNILWAFMLKVASSLRNIRETGYVFISQERLSMMLLLRLRHRTNERDWRQMSRRFSVSRHNSPARKNVTSQSPEDEARKFPFLLQHSLQSEAENGCTDEDLMMWGFICINNCGKSPSLYVVMTIDSSQVSDVICSHISWSISCRMLLMGGYYVAFLFPIC